MFLRSLRNRLALGFALIVLCSLGAVYLSVVPQLEQELREQKLDTLSESAAVHAPSFERTVGAPVTQSRVESLIERASAGSGARVTLIDVATGTEGRLLSTVADSEPQADPDDTRFTVAEQAARTGREARGTEPTTRGRIAEVAVPLPGRGEVAKIVVFSDDLEAVAANVSFIRNRLLLSGVVALLVAVLAGYLVAGALAGRVKRLERAARRVAAGDFSSRIRAEGDDELGRLAGAFDDMQTQLASLQVAREQFIATASHELRTPIFSLGGFLELLEDEDLDEETRREFIEQVRGQVERLGKLATELLDYTRIESGQLTLRPEPTDLGALAREVATEFTPAVQRHRATVDCDIEGDPIEVDCDPERVAQVLRILLDNALVHTPPGTRITVATARANGEARVAVSDSGLGIRRQNMPRIFEPFFSSNDGAHGAGLGLAIASELAERMDGHLDAQSAPGRTTFTLVLPG